MFRHAIRYLLEIAPESVFSPMEPFVYWQMRQSAFRQAREAKPFIQGIIGKNHNAVLIDAGFHKGYATLYWMKHLSSDVHYRGFELRPELKPFADRLIAAHADQDLLVQFAAFGTTEGDIHYFDTRRQSVRELFAQGASVVDAKKTGWLDYSKPKTAPSVDASRVVHDLHAQYQGSPIVLKLDIEGAEFEVLEHLLATDAARLLRGLVVDWHSHHFAPEKAEQLRQRRARIEAGFKEINVPIYAAPVSAIPTSLEV